MVSLYRTMLPVLLFLHMISQQLLTAHEPGKSFHSTGCSYVTKYCTSCTADELGGNQHTSFIVVNCSAKNLTEFPTDLPRTTTKLVLSHNLIARLNLEEMKKIVYLQELWVEENNISFISEKSFRNNFMLESLNMGGNELADLKPGIFQGLKNLLKLNLNQNRIFRLKNGTFQHLISLNKLDLSGNEIFVIERGAFSGLGHLTHLNLANNKLRKVSEFNFNKLASLRTLCLAFNLIEAIEETSFSNLMHLKSLSVNQNNLTAVPKALKFPTALVDLDLSSNPVQFIPLEAFARLHSLEFLNLSFSSIRVFHGKHLKRMLPNLRLYIYHNPLDCTCDLRWLKEWFDGETNQNTTLYNWSQVKCKYPKTLTGKTLMSVNITDMKCSCGYCHKSPMCDPSGKRCNCEHSWAGPSCTDTCHSNVTSSVMSDDLMCSLSQEKCFCSNMSEVCVNNAHLIYSNYSLPDCVCNSGYHGNGILNCTDVDECVNAHNPCHKYADCINTVGSFRCSCRHGYQGDGVLCHSIKHRRIVAIATALVSILMFIVVTSTLIFCVASKRRQRTKEASRSSRNGGKKKKKKKKQSTRRYVDLYRIRELSFTNTVFTQELESSTRVDDWEIPREKLRLIRAIGEGAFGVVMEGALDTDEGTTRVAVKTLKADADRHDYKDLMTELTIMKQAASHPNIVSLLGACSVDGPLYLVMEFVSGGNLLAFLRSNRCQNPQYINLTFSLNERELLKIAEDVANGMNYLSSLNLVHRDLAARNVLLTEHKVGKVTDFGLARDVQAEGVYTKTTTAGRLPVKWMSPESIRFHIYTSKSDVWSFGVLLWEIITIGECPYPGIPARLLAGKLLIGYRMEKPTQCSDELYEVMKACWQLDSEARPTFAELANILHGFLARTGRGYVNLGQTYSSDLDLVRATTAEMCEIRDEESSVTIATEPEVTHEMEMAYTPPNEDHLEQQKFTTKL